MCHGQNTWAVEIEVDLTSSVLQQVRPYLIPKKFYTVSTILNHRKHAWSIKYNLKIINYII